MDNSYAVVMTSLGEGALMKYIHEPDKYVPEAVEAAIQELKRRGKNFSPEEMSAIEKILSQRKEEVKKQEIQDTKIQQPFPAEEPLKEELPKYYSELSLYLISIIFSPFFASILLAINFKRAKKEKGILPVIAFGILYLIFSSFVFLYTGGNLIIYMFVTFGGAFILHQVFWNKYLGKNISYKHRPLWLPIIIFLLIGVAMYFLYQVMGIKLPTGT